MLHCRPRNLTVSCSCIKELAGCTAGGEILPASKSDVSLANSIT